MSWVLVLGLNLLATPYLVSRLTPEIFGLMLIMNGILGYLTIVDFSFRDSLVKYMSEYVAKGRLERAAEVFNSVIIFQLILGVGCSIALIACGHIILAWFNVSSASASEIWTAYLVMSAGFPIALLNGIYANLPVAMQRFEVSAVISSVSGALTIVGSVVLVALGYGLMMLMLWSIIVLVATCIAYHVWMHRTYSWFVFRARIDRSVIAELFQFSLLTQLAKSASMVNDQVVRVMIGSVLGPAAVTYYAVPLRLTNGLQALLDKVARVMFPLASQLAATNDMEILKESYLAVSKYLCILTMPLYLGLAVFSKEILIAWMGAEFADRGALVLMLSAMTYCFISWTMIPSNIAFGLGKAKINAAFSLLVAVVNVILTYFLSRSFGIAGAAAALLITQIQTPFFIVMVSNSVAPGFGMVLLKDAYLKPFACGIVALPIAYLAREFISAPISRLLVGLPLVIVSYYATVLITGLASWDLVRRFRGSLAGN